MTSCKSYVQVYETKSTNTSVENGFYVYENDSLKITYSFWAENGLITFAIYNKLNVPLYVDWKKSSYIQNSLKLNYWEDKIITKGTSINRSYYYDGPLLYPGYAVSKSVNNSVSSSTKIERITFIPPTSNFFRTQFYILPLNNIPVDKSFRKLEIPRKDKPNKTTKIHEKTYLFENSPLIFRNYLTFSYSEGFESEFYVDNQFYISKVTKIDRKVFFKWKLDENDEWVEKSLYQKENIFFTLPSK